MRDVSLFLLKNSLGSKMKKGLRNFCSDDGSTSTLNQHGSSLALGHHDHNLTSPVPVVPAVNIESANCNKHWQINAADHQEMERQPTLEEMILKLDLEEEIARKSKALQLMKESHEDEDNYNIDMIMRGGPGRMSCVNKSDILRSARNALNQYPRFSLDGRDAMYRSSFRNNHLQDDDILGKEKPMIRPAAHRDHRIRSSDVCSSIGTREYFDASGSTTTRSLAGESVVWCKPGVVAKLMGLDAMPVPVSTTHHHRRRVVLTSTAKFRDTSNEKLRYILEQSQPNMITMRRRGDQSHEMEKRSIVDRNIDAARRFNNYKKVKTTGSCSTTSKTTAAAGNYCVMKPIQHSSDRS